MEKDILLRKRIESPAKKTFIFLDVRSPGEYGIYPGDGKGERECRGPS